MSEVSQAARQFRQRVEDEAAFLATCDGGDPGSPGARSIWLLGIEPGWSLIQDAAETQGNSISSEQLSLYPVELQLTWPFNRKAFKLLAALNGGSPDDYVHFASQARPFERGSTGYFKGNLFPEPLNNIHAWGADAIAATGFKTKAEYQTWLRVARFPVVSRWIERCRPKLVIGSGLTFLNDFLQVTGTPYVPEAHRFEINGHTKRIYVTSNGSVPVAVVPHLSGGANGLNSDRAIAAAAEYIRAEIGL